MIISRYAVIDSGMVVNIVLWDAESSWDPGEGLDVVLINEGVDANIGDSYIDGVFKDI
ncbi:hypothetical protein [Hafnia psychrotolerans]|nr:hypothetical protein [Hafnia psychrotolerans]